MATNHLTMNLARWNAALTNLQAAQAAASAIIDLPQCDVHDAILTLQAQAVDRLYEIPAPALGGVRMKLELLWGPLWGQEAGTDFKTIILGDLCRIGLLRVGVDPEDASGGMDLGKVASDWIEAAQEYDGLGRDGPTAEAKAKILSLRAPDLAAVERKLSVLWSARSDPADQTSRHAIILRDLGYFISSDQQ